MDIPKIIELYEENRWSLRMIADLYEVNHHLIKRRLIAAGVVKVPQPNRFRSSVTDEHKAKISASCKGRKAWSKGLKMSKESIYKNMANHLKYNVSLEWLMRFNDIEKLKILNKSIGRKRDYKGFDTSLYIRFIEKFYADEQFNRVYQNWKKKGKEKWLKPFLDHINPRSNNGSLIDLDNLQFLTWFENRCKTDIPQNEWENIKSKIKDYFI